MPIVVKSGRIYCQELASVEVLCQYFKCLVQLYVIDIVFGPFWGEFQE